MSNTENTLFEQGLQQGLQDLGLQLSSKQIAQLCQYAGLISKWNKVYNLTALRAQESILSHHLLDCLAVIAPLRHWVEEQGLSVPAVLDVGSGAGLPGLVIAICQPDWQIHTIDTVGKKTAFMQQAAAQLQLKNTAVHHARVEELAKSIAQRFDLITSRAFSSLPDFLSLTTALRAPTGVWMAMKGKAPTSEDVAELDKLASGFHVKQIQTLAVPQVQAERCLVWIEAKTP